LILSKGTTLLPSACDEASANLFGANDECSRALQELSNDAEVEDIIGSLLNADCPTRFHAYVTACSEQFDDDEVATHEKLE